MYYDKYNRFSGIQLKSLPIVVRNPVRSIYTEDEKTIWFGTKGNGFVRVEDYDSYEKGKIPAEKSNTSQHRAACLVIVSIVSVKVTIIPGCGSGQKDRGCHIIP